MTPLRPLAVLTVAASLAMALPVAAAPVSYTANLSGPNESPANASPGVGNVTVTVDAVAATMHVVAAFSGLTGTTSNAHIHCCTIVPGTGTAGVATTTPSFAGFPLGVTAGSFDQIYDLNLASSYNPAFIPTHGGTIASAEAALLAGLAAGTTYFNIHTSTFGGGEIRGFLGAAPLATVPEPATLALALCALGFAGVTTKRRGA